jgi:hypothetical protein
MAATISTAGMEQAPNHTLAYPDPLVVPLVSAAEQDSTTSSIPTGTVPAATVLDDLHDSSAMAEQMHNSGSTAVVAVVPDSTSALDSAAELQSITVSGPSAAAQPSSPHAWSLAVASTCSEGTARKALSPAAREFIPTGTQVGTSSQQVAGTSSQQVAFGSQQGARAMSLTDLQFSSEHTMSWSARDMHKDQWVKKKHRRS